MQASVANPRSVTLPEEPLPTEDWVPSGIDTERPSSARIYDYFLGGAHNFAVDRQVAEQLIAAYPDVALISRANRAFLRRAVEYLVNAGVRQFLDLGSGIPTVGHVHEIAQRAAPESRIVFVDVDPIAVAHSRLMLADNDRTTVIQEDVRRPEQILDHPDLRGLLDFDEPIAVLVMALLHFLPDTDDPAGIVSRLTAPLTSGSYLAISHGSEDARDGSEAREIYRRSGIDLTWRNRQQIQALFADLELVEPGLVWVAEWRPDSALDAYHDDPTMSASYGGVARKP
jgi:hypothetical protein